MHNHVSTICVCMMHNMHYVYIYRSNYINMTSAKRVHPDMVVKKRTALEWNLYFCANVSKEHSVLTYV